MFNRQSHLARRSSVWSRVLPFLLMAILAAPGCLLSAQQRDFLTTDEVEQVRLTQEPNARMVLYTQFAASRIGQIQDLLKKDSAGRSLLIHDLLEDLVEIIDTIDVVADDALKNGFEINEGMQEVLKQHQAIAAALDSMDAMDLRDRSRYQFQLQMARDTVEDAIELAQEDLAKRKGDVVAKDKKEREQMEAMRTPAEVEEQKQQAAKQAEADKKSGRSRKPPSLYKPGEKPGEPTGPRP